MKLVVKRIVIVFLSILFIVSSSAVASEKDEWQLTQYADASGNQGMFYSLVNQATGSLILVDGGWAQNADQVSQVIDENGGHITAWFLTHYHNDHYHFKE